MTEQPYRSRGQKYYPSMLSGKRPLNVQVDHLRALPMLLENARDLILVDQVSLL
jgi:hypothetical protein